MHIVTRPDGSSDSPITRYARDAVAAVAYDQRQGVLIWRMADHLVGELRTPTGRPTAHLDQVPQPEQDFYVGLAQRLFAMHAAIATDALPTAGEIHRYEQRKQLSLTRARARVEARRFGHELDVFRSAEPGYESAFCLRCRAGVSIHRDTAGLSISDDLQQPCRATR